LFCSLPIRRGIRWEVERALTIVAPQKALLCLQHFDGRQGRYDQFRISVEERAGVKLPRPIGDTMFIFFLLRKQGAYIYTSVSRCFGQYQAVRSTLSERLRHFWRLSLKVVRKDRFAPARIQGRPMGMAIGQSVPTIAA
jgi:hypothetical protein